MRSGLYITLPSLTRPHARVRHFFGTKTAQRAAAAVPSEYAAGAKGWADAWMNGATRGRSRRAGGTGTTRTSGAVTVVSVKQVHGTDVLVVDQPIDRESLTDRGWDAIVTNRPGLLLTVRTADCVPLLIHDPVADVVAAVHAGWRGAVAGIVRNTISVLRRTFASDPRSLLVGIGPSVGPCCYEVDSPVLDKLRENFQGWRSVIVPKGADSAMLDLRELVRRQAEGEGVRREQIQAVRVCTVCYPELFYSYRREGSVRGTMVSGIMITDRPRRR